MKPTGLNGKGTVSRWGLGVMKQRRSSSFWFNHTADYETDWSQNKQLTSHRNERNGVRQMFQYSDHSGDDHLDKDDDDLRGGARGGGVGWGAGIAPGHRGRGRGDGAWGWRGRKGGTQTSSIPPPPPPGQ